MKRINKAKRRPSRRQALKTYNPKDIRFFIGSIELKPCKTFFLVYDCPDCNGSGSVGAFFPRDCDRCEGGGLIHP